MVSNIEYKGFIANYKFDENKANYIAHVVNSYDDIICNGRSPNELRKSLIDCIDLYLDLCKKKGVVPNKLITNYKVVL